MRICKIDCMSYCCSFFIMIAIETNSCFFVLCCCCCCTQREFALIFADTVIFTGKHNCCVQESQAERQKYCTYFLVLNAECDSFANVVIYCMELGPLTRSYATFILLSSLRGYLLRFSGQIKIISCFPRHVVFTCLL